MALTAIQVKATKPTDKPFKLSDGSGLYLLVQPNGSKYCRLDYRFVGKRKTLAVGVYPDVSLLDARARRTNARKLLADGIDPGQNKKAIKMAGESRAANSFEVVAREWHGKFSPGWATTHSSKIIRRLEENIFPWLGARPIAEITAPELLACIRRIESRGILETAHRTLQHCGQVFRRGPDWARRTRPFRRPARSNTTGQGYAFLIRAAASQNLHCRHPTHKGHTHHRLTTDCFLRVKETVTKIFRSSAHGHSSYSRP